ncbi:MAG: Bifunctional phosphoglucose/phosphomannose isomerase [Microgenomates group bacterium GW2011_GWF2_45_18]|nr:MAG: Bifunctional phosphoglucose/phosphomannose isomerase [Microgenomates group bacterium GW2011_GWF1_44_10]KKU02179.1 MAG: Bifunctional phosphoglucose/phosphomannose isomerase [Microgenomates group bacterium GW2011_GWF2_45_18]OGJ40910.1 MAG: hypothetical protein A2378_03165 [Candidatus Pacebacteria bacterium RIFOXYB1_FULL_44_10]
MTKTPPLDSRDAIYRLDPNHMLDSVESLDLQILDMWQACERFSVPESYRSAKNIVVSGMGGSALGGRVVKSLYKSELQIPFELIGHYVLPAYVGKDSLVILSSYSGSTEETLASYQDAKNRGAMLAVITAGGKLLELAKQDGVPYVQIVPKHNPSNQPRMAIGYAITGLLAMLTKAGFLNISQQEIDSAVQLLRERKPFLIPESIEQNTAKLLAYAAVDKQIFFVSAEHLEGATHVFNNQLNENAKVISAEYLIPEMNHHFLESISFPKQLRDSTFFLFIQSSLYHPRVNVRVPITRDIVEMSTFPAETIMATGVTRFSQVWEVIQLGAFTNIYLAVLNGIEDPSKIPYVDFLKEKLAEVK